LRKEGALTDGEFAEGKKRLLGQTAAASPPSTGQGNIADAVHFEEKTFWSSRWSSGNLFFRDRLTMAFDGMEFRKGAMFGSNVEHINYRAVASFRVTNGIFLSNICIETSGGSQPIFVNGLWKSDVREIQEIIRVCQKTG
jgi:hypothetical protein